jgi:ABC-type Fe3+-citrate transport system substrate-binding protein
MIDEPLIPRTPLGVTIVSVAMAMLLAMIGWAAEKVITLDERVSELHADMGNLREWGKKLLEMDERLSKLEQEVSFIDREQQERRKYFERQSVREDLLHLYEEIGWVQAQVSQLGYQLWDMSQEEN